MSTTFSTVLISVFLTLSSICSADNFASQKPDLTRYLRSNNLEEYGKSMKKKIERFLFTMDSPMKKNDVANAHYAIDLYRFSQLMLKANDEKFFTTFRWIEAKPKFLSQLVRNISEEDDFAKVMEILYELIRYELKDKRLPESKYALIIAVALVWDQPREPLHDKMPEKDPEYVEMQPLEVYKHFAALHYHRRLVKYRVSDLIYCVDTPVLQEDVEWVNRVEKINSESQWKNLYFKLDEDRQTLNKVEWPVTNGDYSLRNIKEKGGLVPDIVYCKTMAGRIAGLPIAFFTSYNEIETVNYPVHLDTNFKPIKYTEDIGAYIGSSYTVSPQTGLKVDDYVFDYMHSGVLTTKSYNWADAHYRCAELMHELNDKNIRITYFIWPALKECSLHLKTWDLKERILDTLYVEDEGKIENEIMKGEIYKFYQNKIKAFRKYPDIVYEAKEAYLARLNELENDRLARRYLRDLMKDSIKERVDIYVDLAITELNYRVSTEEVSDGLDFMEKSILDIRSISSYNFRAIEEYLKVADSENRQPQATRFMKKLYGRLLPKFDLTDEKVYKFINYVIDACEKSGDDTTVKKIIKEREKLSEKAEKLKIAAFKKRKKDELKDRKRRN